ncbi:MAG: flippase [Deltaproteobacteria bacterium]|nr:flippase [Deltaproteobacteria bacterium]
MKQKTSTHMLLDILGLIGSRVMLVIFGLATGVITARLLGPYDRGIFTVLLLLPQTLVNFAKMGVAQANVYYIRRRGASVSTIASNSLVLSIAVSIILVAVCYFGRPWVLDPFTKGARTTLVLLALTAIPFTMIESYFLSILQAIEDFRAYNLQSIYKAVFGFLTIAVALLALHGRLWAALFSQVLVTAGANVWLLYRVRKIAPFGIRWDGGLGRGMLAFGAKSYLQTLAAHLHYRIDVYLIAFFLDPAQVAFYSIAVNITNPILQIPDAIGTVIFPKLAASSEADAHTRTAMTCRHTLFATILAAVFYAGVGSQALTIFYGDRYAPAIRPMLLMLPGIIMISLYQILTRNFTSRNRQQVNIVAAGIALGVNFALNLILIPRFGISGAAVSTAISYTLAALLLLFIFVRESGGSLRGTIMIRGADLATYPRMLAAAGDHLRGREARHNAA